MDMISDENRRILQESKTESVPVKERIIPLRPQVSAAHDRLTIVMDVYREHFGDEPFGKHVIANQQLESSSVEPYTRKIKVTETERELDLGDVPREQVGYILLLNLEGVGSQQNPMPEERLDIMQRVVLFDDYELAPYGMPFLGQPTADKPLKLRCLHGQAVIQEFIYPK